MFKLRKNLPWRQIKGKKKDIISEFSNKEMEQQVHKFYMHNGIMPMTFSMESPYKAGVFIEHVNKGAKQYI